MQKQRIQLRINGEPCEFWVTPNTLLMNLLRNEMELTGTKYGCGTGQCGGCTVLVDGEPILSCLTLALAVDGTDILTIEGGYCTPGMVLMAKDLLNKNPSPSEDQIREHIKGNLCRCTGYHRIVQAIKSCSE